MAERDKWGRIPAVLVEQDQEFCAWNWGELPCQAGPQSNLQIFSIDPGETSFWSTDGSINGVLGTPLDPTYGATFGVNLSASNGFLTSSNPSLLPTITDLSPLYISFVYQNDSSVTSLTAGVEINGAAGILGNPGFTFNPTNDSVISTDSGISGIEFGPFSDNDFLSTVTFTLDPSVYVSEGESFTAFLNFLATAGSGTIQISYFKISTGPDQDFRATLDDPVLVNDQPCFNTLSSCQALQTYKISELTDAVLISTGSSTYSITKPTTKEEGVYLEFYFLSKDAEFATFSDETLIDVDGKLTASYGRPDSGNPPRVTFSSGGGSLSIEVSDSVIYKFAAFVSRSGSLRARGIPGVAQGTPLSGAITEVTLSEPPSATRTLAIADLLVYDYEVKRIEEIPRANELFQKGDSTGDSIFYAKFNRVTGIEDDQGLEPSNPSNLFISNLILSSNIDPENTAYSLLSLFNGSQTKNAPLLEPPLTLRYTKRNMSSRLPETLRAIPSMINASNKPAQLQVGGTNENISSLGSRDELSVMFEDHPYSDFLVDPYRDQRTYDPITQGTYWGKWLARNVYKQGQAVRYVTGYELDNGGFERVHTYNYILDKVNGPTSNGKVTMKAFDILQSLRADRAVFPAPSTGRLLADISDTATTATLDPVGIGDEEYPTGLFRIRIGGEGFDVTRSGDVLTFDGTGGTQRGLYGGAESHTADDLVQVVARFEGEQVHDVAEQIIVGALPELQGFIPKEKWDGLAADFLPRNYSADITEPTGVEDLLAELTATAPIYFYADVRTNLIELGVIREPSSAAVELTEGNQLIADTVDLKEYPKERIDEVWVYYRIRDAAGEIDDQENYSQRFILVNPQEQAFRGRRSIKRIYTRWIVAGARDTAEEIAQAYISRFQNQPIRVSFDLDAKVGDIWLGDVAKLISRQKQTVTGESRNDLNYQVIQAHEPEPGHAFQYIAQSYEFFSPVDVNKITITIQPEDNIDGTGAVDQIDLRELYDATVATEIDDITFVVAGGPLPSGGTVVGSGAGQTWSLNNPNDWPWAPTIELRIEPGGAIVGRAGTGGAGGNGGAGGSNGLPGTGGQTGLRIRYATNVNNLGIIGAGGGGGGGGGGGEVILADGGGGGGGAGKQSIGGLSQDQPNGQPGSPTEGGLGGVPATVVSRARGGTGGRGGDLAQAGLSGAGGTDFDGTVISSGGAGGAPGNAVDGVSFVTYITRGDIRGNEV